MRRLRVGLTAEAMVFLEAIKDRVVIIGGVARGVASGESEFKTKDLDLLYDFNNHRAYEAVKRAVKAAQSRGDLARESRSIGHWWFDEDEAGIHLELMPYHYGPEYKTIRRRVFHVDVDGLVLMCAEGRDCPADKTDN